MKSTVLAPAAAKAGKPQGTVLKEPDVQAGKQANRHNALLPATCFDFGKVQIHNGNRASLYPNLQAKLKINQPGDVYEQEADNLAEEIVRQAAPPAESSHNPTRRSGKQAFGHLQQKPGMGTQAGPVPAAVPYAPGTSAGKPLGAHTTSFMEPRFGYDFSQVRIHDDERAAASAAAINAYAYTVGNNIVFNKGLYAPETERGKKLLAHELAHVVQQDSSGHTHKKLSSYSGAPGIQRQSEPQGETNQHRLIASFLPGARPAIRRVLGVLRAIGLPVSGIAIGVRLSGTAGDTVQAGMGVDALYFLDVANLELTTDTLAYGELGVGLSLGAGGGIIIGFRISPNAQYGTMSGAYGGHTYNFTLRLLAGVGLSISPGIFQGQEGFVAATFSVGAQAGINFSYSYGVSGADMIEAIETRSQQITTAITSGLQTIRSVTETAGGVTQSAINTILVRPILTARASLMPSNWNLDALPTRTRNHLRVLGSVLVLGGTADAMLAYMSRRLNSFAIQPLILDMSADIQQVLIARGNAAATAAAALFTPAQVGNLSVMNFIRLLSDHGLLRFIRPPEVIADEMMQQQTTATP